MITSFVPASIAVLMSSSLRKAASIPLAISATRTSSRSEKEAYQGTQPIVFGAPLACLWIVTGVWLIERGNGTQEQESTQLISETRSWNPIQFLSAQYPSFHDQIQKN